jgi:hypothetical protein
MIDLAIQTHHAENVERLVRIETRIIAIDGNGTGRIGAVQRIELAISALTQRLDDTVNSLGAVKIDIGGSLKTKTVWAIGASLGVAVLGASGSLFASWLAHRMGWK